MKVGNSYLRLSRPHYSSQHPACGLRPCYFLPWRSGRYPCPLLRGPTWNDGEPKHRQCLLSSENSSGAFCCTFSGLDQCLGERGLLVEYASRRTAFLVRPFAPVGRMWTVSAWRVWAFGFADCGANRAELSSDRHIPDMARPSAYFVLDTQE